MERPLVSVVIPAYNHAPYVARAIQSVLNQTYEPIELVVVDDGSTDGTWNVIEHIRNASGGRFQSYRKENGGVSSALNFGIEKTTGPLIAIVASDDWFVPEKIEWQVQRLSIQGERVVLVHGAAYNVFPDGRIVSTEGTNTPAVGSSFKELLSLKVHVVAPSVLFRRHAYMAAGGFDEAVYTEDRDFYVSLAALGYELYYDPQPVVYKMVTGTNAGGNVAKCLRGHLAILEKHRGSISNEEYECILDEIYVAAGRSYARQEAYALSWEMYKQVFRRRRSAKMLVDYVANSCRTVVLSALPPAARHRLRLIRAALGEFIS